MTEYGADVNARDNYDSTPLMFTAYFGKIEVVRMLISELQVNLETKRECGNTA